MSIGGTHSECTYIDGVVFRKNVSHKKMSGDGTKTDPKILLLAGGIEFQRTEIKLSSMDTLIEQEDKYMEILVEKIMSLKPGRVHLLCVSVVVCVLLMIACVDRYYFGWQGGGAPSAGAVVRA